MALELLYDLLLTEDNRYETAIVDEVSWEDEELLVWISHEWFEEFIEEVNELFEDWDEKWNTTAIITRDCVCINLSKMLVYYVNEDELRKMFEKQGEK